MAFIEINKTIFLEGEGPTLSCELVEVKHSWNLTGKLQTTLRAAFRIDVFEIYNVAQILLISRW